MGRPSLAPGVYFRCIRVAYFEGIDSEREIACRISDRLRLREFLVLSLEEPPRDHLTRSKTRRRSSLRTHQAVLRWVLRRLTREGLRSGKKLRVDATTRQAPGAWKRSCGGTTAPAMTIPWRHTESQRRSGGVDPARRQRSERRGKKPLSHREWVNPHDPEARITQLKDGRTQLACQAEHAMDLDTGAVVALTVQPTDGGDPESLRVTLGEAGSVLTERACQASVAEAVGPVKAVSEVGLERVAADKGYPSQRLLQELAEVGVRTLIAEPERRRQRWAGQRAAQAAGYANRRRLKSRSGQALMRRRGTLIERPLPIRTTRAACAGWACAARTPSPSGR